MKKVSLILVTIVILLGAILLFMLNVPEEPNVIRILENKGYSSIEVVNKQTIGFRDQEQPSITSNRVIINAKAVTSKKRNVQIEISYNFPFGKGSEILVKELDNNI